MRHHLVILREPYLDRMLAGSKRIECRLSAIRRAPFEAVRPGDLLWFKLPSGPVRAAARAGRCVFHRPAGASDLARIVEPHAAAIQADAGFFDGAGSWARFVSLIWIECVVALRPMRIVKADQRAWVVLKAPPRPGDRVG